MKLQLVCVLALFFIVSSCATNSISQTPDIQSETTTETIVIKKIEPTKTLSPVPTFSPTPSPTQVGGGSGKIIFEYMKPDYIETFPGLAGEMHVFIADLDGANLSPVTAQLDGFNDIEDISPNGRYALIASMENVGYEKNQIARLNLIDLNSIDYEPMLLANVYPPYFWNSTAKWVNDETFVYIGMGDHEFGITLMKIDGSPAINLYSYQNNGEDKKPSEIIAIDKTRIYWASEVSKPFPNNPSMRSVENYIWWTSLDGKETNPLLVKGKQLSVSLYWNPLVLSSDYSKIAWSESAKPESGPPYHNYIHIASLSDLENLDSIDTFTGHFALKWLPADSGLLALDYGSFTWPEHNSRDNYGLYEVPISTESEKRNYYHQSSEIKELIDYSDSVDLYDISPDGYFVIIASKKFINEQQVDKEIYLLNLETLSITPLDGFHFSNPEKVNIHWLN
jgi:hypothetical protein